MNSACTINVNIIRIIYNLLIKNIIDMSVDTVNTIVDITTLAQVQNELTNLADTLAGIACTADTMATVCKTPNDTCSGACATPTIITGGTEGTVTVAKAWEAVKTTTYCVPAAGATVTIAAGGSATADPKTDYASYTVVCAKTGDSAMFLKAVSSVVAATMVMHLA